MEFYTADLKDFDLVYGMMLRAKERLYEEKIYQWDETYPKEEMIRGDLERGYTSLVKKEGQIVAFFTSNCICEDDDHNEIEWMYDGDKWVFLHRLCIDPIYQNQGLGQQILVQFEEQAKAKEFECIRIDVFATNKKAIHIYEKSGYTKLGEAVCNRGPFYVYEKIF